MALIEPKGRPYIACPKCKTNIVWPEGLSAENKKEIASISRRNRWEAVRFIHTLFPFDLREAKALSLHITQESGKCHRCDSPVSDEVFVCAKCRSANLNW